MAFKFGEKNAADFPFYFVRNTKLLVTITATSGKFNLTMVGYSLPPPTGWMIPEWSPSDIIISANPVQMLMSLQSGCDKSLGEDNTRFTAGALAGTYVMTLIGEFGGSAISASELHVNDLGLVGGTVTISDIPNTGPELEVQTITYKIRARPPTGSYTLQFGSNGPTDPIPFGGDASAIQVALGKKVGVDNVRVKPSATAANTFVVSFLNEVGIGTYTPMIVSKKSINFFNDVTTAQITQGKRPKVILDPTMTMTQQGFTAQSDFQAVVPTSLITLKGRRFAATIAQARDLKVASWFTTLELLNQAKLTFNDPTVSSINNLAVTVVVTAATNQTVGNLFADGEEIIVASPGPPRIDSALNDLATLTEGALSGFV